ncbi:MAG: hypothetical protein JNL74_18165, partial [Fibrobacteres bacterium]|nr:hypothetical protein [Fibrobacterota bacterium]
MNNANAVEKLLSTVTLPIGNAIILIDSDWKIKEYLQTSVLYNTDHSHLSVFEKLLEKESHLSKFFRIYEQTGPSLENTFVGPFPIKLYWQNRIFDYYFFSALPLYYCQIYRLVNNNLVAVVYYSPNLPRNDHLEEPVIFYDHWQRLKAFNLPFYNLLKVKFLAPEKLYNISLNTLFAQTPEVVSNNLLSGVHKELRNASWKPCSFANRRGGWSVSEESFCQKQEKGSFHLYNRSDTFLLLTLNKQLSEVTYNLEFRIESSSGRPPIIMVGLHGYSAPNSLTPDQAGYSIGYSTDNKTVQFKKKGYLI